MKTRHFRIRFIPKHGMNDDAWKIEEVHPPKSLTENLRVKEPLPWLHPQASSALARLSTVLDGIVAPIVVHIDSPDPNHRLLPANT